VILEERNQRVDNEPNALFAEQQRAALYLNHPYGRPVIGWRSEIATLNREKALDFYRTYYAPNNATLVVAGDVDPAEVEALAETHYGPLAPSEDLPPRVRPAEPPHLAERRVRFSDPRNAQPYVMRNYLAPERNSGDQRRAAALSILADLLGGSGLTSVLGEKLQLDAQIAIVTSAYYNPTSYDPTRFGMYVVPADGVSLEEAEAALDRVLEDFMAEGVDPEQLERVKGQMRAALIYEQDNLQSLARRYGAALSVGLTVEDIQAWPDVLQSITAEEIMAAAEDVFDRRASVTGWFMRPDQEVTQ